MSIKRSFFYKTIFLLIILAGIGASGLFYLIFTLKIPDFEAFESRKIVQSTKIYDKTGKILLWDIHQNIQRTVVPMDKISLHLKNATVAIEDSTFYQHRGIDPVGIIRAAVANISSGSLEQGGSTISQQLIKNSLLTRDKSFLRKIKEVILTLKLERTISKDQILELYLNEIPYGGSNYGVETASRNFLGKPANQLSLAEAAYLAALPKAPTYFSPYGNHRDELEQRKNLILNRMLSLGFITEEEEVLAKKEKINFLNKGDQSLKAPHFSIFIRSYLENKYGKDALEEDGLKITTTLDYKLQVKAEELVAKYAKDNKEKFNASNAALTAIDPKTGQILAMVGSKDYFNEEDGGNFNVTLARRQPGSSIKPFVYATAFKKGFTPDTVLFDLDTEFNSSCDFNHAPKPGTNTKPEECYSPENYDHIFRGPITLKNALAQSVNVPSVKTLYLAGIKNSLATMFDMGITTLNEPGRYGLTLVLGGGEVSLLEMTGAYSVFANNGAKNKVTGILKIENSHGDILEEYKPSSDQVLDKNIALLINDILSDNDARAPAFGQTSALYFPDRQVAVKTGTTNDYRDAWVVGYTPNLAVGVWCGNNDNSSMEKKVAGFIAAPLWNAFFAEAFNDLEKENFDSPEKLNETKPVLRGEWQGGETYKIDKISGKLATLFTPQELVTEKPLTQVHSILYWLNKDDPLGSKPENPSDDPQFYLWENPIRDWATKQGIKDQTINDVPKDYDDIHKPEYAPIINIISPIKETLYSPNEKVGVVLSAQTKFGLEQVDYFLDNTYLGSLNKEPFIFSFVPSSVKEVEESANLKIIAYDKVKNKTEAITQIKFNY
jgi:1A family penicillin-binding protein